MAFREKNLIVLPPVEIAGRYVKRYHVPALGSAGIEPEVEKAAYAVLPELFPEPDGTPPASFVVLHRGGDTGAYLNAYNWTWDSVLHFAGAAAGQPALDCPDLDPTHFVKSDPGVRNWIGCVWELGPFGHERDAWIRHMLAPGTPDLAGYLGDAFPSDVTGPAVSVAPGAPLT
ncbi:hypothetical protein ACFYU9_18295 [Streptomyces sp. NPDC004327]|uniref:hypothetical protein n=1 Tax=Streptomyces sp. NPDC004327 TaxID=3364699 RepID=UPI0036A2C7F7